MAKKRAWVTSLLGLFLPALLGGVATVIGLIIPAWQAFLDHDHPKAGPLQAASYVVGAVAAVTAIALSVQRTVTDKSRQQKELEMNRQLTLLGAVQVLCGLLREKKKLPLSDNDGKIRITIHRVMLDNTEHGGSIQQILPYVGGRGGIAGRSHSIKTGIIGYVVRTELPHTKSRDVDNFPEYTDELVRNWGYTEREAKEKQSDRMSWMAVPILAMIDPQKGDEVIGVIYLDADVINFFDQETKEFVLAGCEGIKKHINEVFTKD